jgi:WD40 repeat protein
MSEQAITQSSNSINTVDRRNPFPGLRSFKYEESHLYFGRDNQIEMVLNKLIKHRFVAVVGTSGIGKSSFLYCGLFPTLFGDYQTEYSNKWEVCTFRPGESPIKNLAQSITDEAVKNNPELDAEMTFNVEYSTLMSSSTGLVDAFKGKYDKYKKNYLIFVDQFEELFRFKDIDSSTTEETLAFIKLLLTATEQSDVPIYVALTMRSDFVGDCSQYPNLTNAINNSQFLIPQMTRNEKKAAIEGPIQVMGASIDDRLVQQILNDVGDNADQLPIMQHALMRTWDYWEQSSIHGEPINTGHYEAIGGMKTALEVHANEAFNELSDEQKRTCELIFKAITQKGDDGRRVRRPTQLSEIAAVAEKSIEECIAVIDNFRRADRTLLMPPQEVPLDENSVIDISHESLMRIWGMLIFWVDEEADFVKEYLGWAVAAENHQSGQGGLLKDADLKLALAKREEKKPNLAWGMRYHPAYERTMSFLDFSKKSDEEAIANRKKLAERRKQIFRAIFAFIVVIMFGALIASYFAYEAKQEANKNLGEAKAQKEKAVASAKAATIAEKKAVKSADQARVAQGKAVKAAEVAKQEQKNALRSAKLARAAKIRALQEKKMADEQRKKAVAAKALADTATKKAEKSADEARKAKVVAEDAKTAADNLSKKVIAQKMGLRSIQLTNPIEQALVAQQAYHIFKKSNARGETQDPNIYDGLYYAIKKLSDRNYNQFKGHFSTIRSLEPTFGNVIYSTGSDGTIRKCDVGLNLATGADIPVLQNTNEVNRSLSLSPGKKVMACAGNSASIRLYNVANDGSLSMASRVKTGQSEIRRVIMAGNSVLYALSANGEVTYWEQKRRKWNSDLIGKDKATLMAANSQKVAWDKAKNVIVYNNRVTNKNYELTISSQDRVVSLEFSQDGVWLAAGTQSGFLYLWNVNNGKPRSMGTEQSLPRHLARINNIAFNYNDDGRATLMATGSWDKSVRIYELGNLGKSPIVLNDHRDWVWSICFSGDGTKLLAGCKDNLIRVWPTTVEAMKDIIASTGKVKRNMSIKEWDRHVSKKINYAKTFSNFQDGEGVKAEDKVREQKK